MKNVLGDFLFFTSLRMWNKEVPRRGTIKILKKEVIRKK
jgi:hypothetical protein